MNQVAVQNPGALHAIASGIDEKAVVEQVRAIQKIMQTVMKEGTHYGVIPGCKQPSLYKAGSETLLSAFKISVEPEIEEIRDGDHITVKVRAIGRHMTSGIVVGVGVGECSTAEEKYSWRTSVCDEEYDATKETQRRLKWFKGYARENKPPYSVKQVRTNPADLANTVLKMAKKRAQVDLSLTCLAASDIFTQDIEDLPAEYVDDFQNRDKPANNKYQPKEAASRPMYSVENFDKNFPAWEQLIATGKKTADAVIAQIESKGALTDDQKNKIRDVKVAQTKPQEVKIEGFNLPPIDEEVTK